MKNQSFAARFGFALHGLRVAFASERSFRTQCGFAVAMLLMLVALRPPVVWWALCLLSAAIVLGLELVNTALEHALDQLHPERHHTIRVAKDCAAGAVLVASAVAAVVGILTVAVSVGWL